LRVAATLNRIAEVRPPPSLPENSKFFRSCRARHYRNYAQFPIMRSSGRSITGTV
jgi:hypothetical protein